MKFSFLLSVLCFITPFAKVTGYSGTTDSYILKYDLTDELRLLNDTRSHRGFDQISNVAQHKDASWDNVIGLARSISISEAAKIAEKNPEITYFFYVKGHLLVLENSQGQFRWFQNGDAVFFTGSPEWGPTPGLADSYVRSPFNLN